MGRPRSADPQWASWVLVLTLRLHTDLGTCRRQRAELRVRSVHPALPPFGKPHSPWQGPSQASQEAELGELDTRQPSGSPAHTIHGHAPSHA